MKDLLAGVLFLVFIGIITFACIQQGKKYQSKRWAKVSINFDRKRVIESEAKINEFDPDYGRAIVWVESRGNSEAVSKTGCAGIWQLNKGNAKTFGISLEERHDDLKATPIAYRLLKESRDFYHSKKAAAIRQFESCEEYILREYTKGRDAATKNFFAGKTYAKHVMLAYKAIKDGSLQYTFDGKIVKIDLAKINGEA